MARWSKLQRQLYLLRVPDLKVQVQCRVYPMRSTRGSTGLPRYWITLGKDIIWDYPKQFVLHENKYTESRHTTERGDRYTWYPYQPDVTAISELIREYIDTPASQVLSKRFPNDHWGLVDILRACDRRVGARQWQLLRERSIDNNAAVRILDARTQLATKNF